MANIKYQISAGTNMGLVRKNNEDNFLVCPDLTSNDWRIPQIGTPYTDLGQFGALLVVADGMGGANAGEVASAIAVETVQLSFLPERLGEVVKNDKTIQEFMKEVVKTADARIFKHSKTDRNTRGMGTTIVMAWILENKVYVCWCGDSRCYMLNKRRGLMQLSKDHSYVQELVDRGELEPEFAADHPLSNVITRCLGDNENRAVPDTRIFQLHDGDTILLCSDGLSGMCNDIQILDLLIKYRDNIVECKNELITAALNEGGNDNVTVALCNIDMPDNQEQPEDDDEVLPKGLLPSETPSSQMTTIRNSQSAKQPTVLKRNNNNALLLVFGVIVIMAMTFFVVRYINNNGNVVKQTEQKVHKPKNVITDSIPKNIETSDTQNKEKNEVSIIVPLVESKTNDTLEVIETKDSINKQN